MSVIPGTMKRTTPEQRELCRLLSPLHERFCDKHHRGCGASSEFDLGAANDSNGARFSLSEFRSALDELWSAAKALDRFLKQRDMMSEPSPTKRSGEQRLGLFEVPKLAEPTNQGQA